MKPLDSLALQQIERRLNHLKKQGEVMQIRTGWIRYIRTALAMSLDTLAKRADTHMALEDQAVKSTMEERIERLSEKLIHDGDIW